MRPLTKVDDGGRECICCGVYKPWSEYNKGSAARGMATHCRPCSNDKLRTHRKENPELIRKYCNDYEKTHKGFLMRLYRNMKSRITGVQKAKFHLYEGKELLPKEEFYEWAINDPTFHELFIVYKDSGYEMKLAPSVDRVDSSLGYSLDNMEFVTHSENSRRGSISKHRSK